MDESTDDEASYTEESSESGSVGIEYTDDEASDALESDEDQLDKNDPEAISEFFHNLNLQ